MASLRSRLHPHEYSIRGLVSQPGQEAIFEIKASMAGWWSSVCCLLLLQVLLPAAYCNSYYLLSSASRTAHYLLPTVTPTAYYLLPVVYCLLSTPETLLTSGEMDWSGHGASLNRFLPGSQSYRARLDHLQERSRRSEAR